MKNQSNISKGGGIAWTIPTIGMGATISMGSDRYPATIIQITHNGKRIVLQEDSSIRTDNNGVSEIQTYEFFHDENGKIHFSTLRKDGTYRITGSKFIVHIGSRAKYYDYSF